MKINAGRWTATHDGELIVFLIGMRINRPRRVTQWWPVFTAMPKMIRWLDAHPQAGLLHYEWAVRSPISPMLVQYWRSFEDLERFARSPDAPHLVAWQRFNATVRDSGDVGIWHETYRVAAGRASRSTATCRPAASGPSASSNRSAAPLRRPRGGSRRATPTRLRSRRTSYIPGRGRP